MKLCSRCITQAVYSILGNKLKQSTVMSEKYGVPGDESGVDGRNSNQGKTRTLVMIGIVKKSSTWMKMSQQEIIMVTRMMKKSSGKSTVTWLYHRN